MVAVIPIYWLSGPSRADRDVHEPPGFQADSSYFYCPVSRTVSLAPHSNMTTSLLSQGTQSELDIFAASCLEGSLL